MDETIDASILSKAREILEQHTTCDHCLGRQFGWLSTETSNESRGQSIKLVLSMMADNLIKSGRKDEGISILRILAEKGMCAPAQTLAERNSMDLDIDTACYFCTINEGSIFDAIPSISERVKVALKDIEFNTFLVGSVPAPVLVEREDELRADLELLHGETLKADFNRELGKCVHEIIERPVDFDQPDLVVIYDMQANELEVRINPIFISGRYRKLKRGIPQSRWDCRKCRGKGCENCNQTGRMYPDSVSDYIGEPMQDAFQGTKFKFHGAGREDIDALMLGAGRPFVVEVSEPRVRSPDLRKLTKTINKGARKKVEVDDLELSSRAQAQNLKESASSNIKEYEALIQTNGVVDEKAIREASIGLSGISIQQRTPQRVSHRRSDLMREKQIFEVRLKLRKDGLIEGFFKVQGGTYIKELISGDEGRTTPSISEKLGTSCECVELNVTAIYSDNTP
jgi:tRNA pseudouridine synthase 10